MAFIIMLIKAIKEKKQFNRDVHLAKLFVFSLVFLSWGGGGITGQKVREGGHKSAIHISSPSPAPKS